MATTQRMTCTIIYLVLSVLYSWLSPGSVTIASGQVQMTNVKVLERGDDWQCPSMEERERARNEIHQIVNSVITFIHVCNGTSGWRHIAFINMTDTSYNCPTGLNLTTYSKRTCGRSHTETYRCSSTMFNTGDIPYSQVCGRISGYQYGSTSAFGYSRQDINGYYVDGVSLTHRGAGRRQHIWTFAAGLTEMSRSLPSEDCPCDTSRYDRVPTFIGDDYFCESGLHLAWSSTYFTVLHSNDVLWDGQDCTSTSTCCQLNNPPWFTN